MLWYLLKESSIELETGWALKKSNELMDLGTEVVSILYVYTFEYER